MDFCKVFKALKGDDDVVVQSLAEALRVHLRDKALRLVRDVGGQPALFS